MSRQTRGALAALTLTITAWGCSSADSAVPEASADVLQTRPSSEPLPARFGAGRPASDADVARLDIDIRADGAGLPDGSGTVAEGAAVYLAKCAACHGAQGEGTTAAARLVSPPDSLEFPDGVTQAAERAKTIGSYWPYSTTVFDYVRRAMPFDRPGSLTDGELYAVTAWLLWRNGLIDSSAVMDRASLPRVQMPARDRFAPDDRLTSTRVR